MVNAYNKSKHTQISFFVLLNYKTIKLLVVQMTKQSKYGILKQVIV